MGKRDCPVSLLDEESARPLSAPPEISHHLFGLLLRNSGGDNIENFTSLGFIRAPTIKCLCTRIPVNDGPTFVGHDDALFQRRYLRALAKNIFQAVYFHLSPRFFFRWSLPNITALLLFYSLRLLFYPLPGKAITATDASRRTVNLL